LYFPGATSGSGKTAAYALPALERLLHRSRTVAATYVLILAPTRELAVQVTFSFLAMSAMPLKGDMLTGSGLHDQTKQRCNSLAGLRLCDIVFVSFVFA
jgi:superfamily II DNA/RNA helicase